MELEEKRLYSYKQALSQPYWIHKLNDDFSLPEPVKFSQFVYGFITGGAIWFSLSFLIPFSAVGFRAMVAGIGAIYFSSILSDLVVDGKSLVVYLKDYFIFYMKYGYQSDDIYINKGQVYLKPDPVMKLRKEDDAVD